MSYSIIGILASIILVIINRDILWQEKELDQVQKSYRRFLMGVMTYYITDLLWGILDEHGLTSILYADTEVHFIAMAAAVMLWTQYVISYLDSRNTFEKILNHTGRIFFAFALVVIIVNLFLPVLFWFDKDGGYHAGPFRFLILGIQILMFLLTSIHTLRVTYRSEGTMRLRHLTIGLFGIAMMVLIAIQVFYPLMPFYAMGYMLGTCVLHSFVVEDEKEEYRRRLENAVQREHLQRIELAENREALREALALAEHASQAKTAFLSNMSHEIRTPMNTIIGLNSIALKDPNVSEDTKKYLEKIGDSAQHLLELINNILDMSRIESGRVTIKTEDFSLRKALSQVETIIDGQCRDKGLDFDCQIHSSVSDYYAGDATKLKQILINILGNAVKFTPEGGKVTFIAEETGGQNVEKLCKKDDEETGKKDGMATLKFTIQDTGVGISKEFLPHLFDAFSQEDSSYTNSYGSTGLGMSITKSLINLMDGQINVESEKGVGTTFYVTVTMEDTEQRTGDRNDDVLKASGGNDTAQKSDDGNDDAMRASGGNDIAQKSADGNSNIQRAGGETQSGRRADDGDNVSGATSADNVSGATSADNVSVMSHSGKRVSTSDDVSGTNPSENRAAGQNVPEPQIDLNGRCILLAEDLPINAEIMIMILSTEKINTELAKNGRIALEMFENHEPGYYDAILMDMRMPEMDGIEATKAIRSLDREDARSIPIIALTANAFDEDVERSLQAGLNAHLSKPVDSDELFRTLTELIRK